MTHKIFRSFFVLILVIVSVVVPAPQTARAAGPWYVTPTGDDNNDCLSPGTACGTINGAIGKAAAGDTIMVAAGTYTGSAGSVVNIPISLTFSGGWNATFTTRNGISIIDGQNTGRGISLVNSGTHNVTLDHFVIQNGFGFSGGGVDVNGDFNLTINNTTLINNIAYYAGGGGIAINGGTVILNNTTITGNQAMSGAGYGGGGIFIYGGTMIINNSTVAGNNAAEKGGGIYGGFINGGTLTIHNSILANNSANISGPDCFGTINSSEHNIIGNTSGCTITPGAGDQFNVNPLISTYPVGVAVYYTLMSGSPAIDAGNPATCLATDQRGMSRPQGSICDIGAYEYVATPGAAASFGYAGGSNQQVAPGASLPKPLGVYFLDINGTAVSGVAVTFTAPASGPSGTFADSGTNITAVLSDSSGIALSSTFTANSELGSYNVTATASGFTDSVTFALTNAAWYVSPNGDDSNSCDSSSVPCLTINGAIDKAVDDGTIYVASGTYTSASDFVVSINKNISLSGSWDPTFMSRSAPSIIDGQNTRPGIGIGYLGTSTVATIEYFRIENGFFCSGSGIFNYGSLTLQNSTLMNNSTHPNCGAGGGGIFSYGTLITKNTTISSNISHHGAGIYISGGSAELNNTTLADNSSTNVGGGIFVESGTLTVRNSIVARNSATNSGPDCLGTIATSDHNIIGNTADCTVTSGTGDKFNVDPLLSTFLSTQGYYPLLSNSPAIDAGDNATCLNVDQRGVTRPQGTGCDIGAYEYTTPGPAASLSVVGGDNQIAVTSSAFSRPLQAAALDSQGSPVSGVTIDFNAPVSGPSGTFADTGTNTTSADTDAGGVATTSIFTANDQVGAYTVSASAIGLGSVDFNLEQILRPANDNFADAQVIGSLPFNATVDITEASNEPDEPQPCQFLDRTAWYSLTPTQTMIVGVGTEGSEIDGNVNIFRLDGSGISNLTFLDCGDTSNPQTLLAEVGQTYYLQVGSPFGAVGSIQINLEEVAAITGRVTDAVTGAPLPGDAPPFAFVTLRRCDETGCNEFVNQQQADSNGRFRFFNNATGVPLPTGMYQILIEVSAGSPYQTGQVGPFSFVEGQDLDLGDIPLTPLPPIGSISGRVIDAVTGKPIPAAFAPFVTLIRCDQSGCFTVNSQAPDGAGQFRFETDNGGNPLTVGTYQVVAFADQFEQGQTDLFDVGEGEHRVIDVRLNSLLPVRFSEIQPCADLPATGGECVYSVKITNGLATKLQGAAWSLVDSSLPGSFAGFTNFQTKQPQGINLAPGKSKVIQFKFRVPANNTPNGSYVCAQVYVGQGNMSLFNTVGQRGLFCVFRGAAGFTIMTPEELQASFQQSQANEQVRPLSETANEQVVTATNGTDIEPNDTCSTAQDAGAVTLPFVLDGNLDSSQIPDVDFFRFSGTPNASIVVDLEGAPTSKGTVGDPFLGFFDSNCNLVTLNDDSGTLNSRLEITIPTDGVFILAATVCCDGGFTGGGNGTYELTITPLQVIGSISGRVTDAVTGKFLRGDLAPFADVRLLRCEEFGCFEVNAQAAGSDGRFHFTSDQNGGPLRTGTYQVFVEADQYQPGQTEPFEVGEGENRDVGDVPLQSYPVRFSNVQSCVVPSGGGTCEFSVTVTNGMLTRLDGKAWIIVDGSGLGSFIGFTRFQTSDPQAVSLIMAKSKVLRFRFRMPGTVADGATICTQVFVGQGKDAFFNTVGAGQLFCLAKGTGGFTLLSEKEAQTAFRELQNSDLILPNSKEAKKK